MALAFLAVAGTAFAAGWWLARSKDQALKDAVAALSAEALRQNNQSFLQLARSSIDPVKETLEKLDAHLRDSGKDQASLRGQLVAVSRTQEQLQAQTQALVNALKSPNQRGRWGE